jgi:hypothetical protein
MLKKVAESEADFQIIMFNHDAVRLGYSPKTKNKYFVSVQVGAGDSQMVPQFSCTLLVERGAPVLDS